MTTYLKFDSENEFNDAFAEFAIEDAIPAYIGTTAVDVVGVIYKPTGRMLAGTDGLQYPEMVPIEGWHVNLSGEVPELAAFEIEAPASPARVFAGA